MVSSRQLTNSMMGETAMSEFMEQIIESSLFDYLGPKKGQLAEFSKTVSLDKDTDPKRKLRWMLWYLAKWKMPFESVLAALIYAGRISYSDRIFPIYNHDIIRSVLELEELSRPPFAKNDSEAKKRAGCGKRLSCFFNTGYNKKTDLLLLCLANHLSDIEDIRHSPDIDDLFHIQAIVEECMLVFIPLTEMLGTWKIRRRLLEHIVCLPTITRKRRRIRKQRKNFIRDYRLHTKAIVGALNASLRTAKIEGRVRRHINNPGSLYHRLKTGSSIREVTKKIRLDVIVGTEAFCYLALGLTHGVFPPDPSIPFKDFIASPKYNGYRALVTFVRYPPLKGSQEDIPVEIRICTEEMRRINEYGVIAPNLNGCGATGNAWWEKGDHFREGDIHVFSPIGEVFHLPKGSTALDYAYHVHCSIGNNCRRICVDGAEVPFNRELENGNLVHIEVEKGFQGANEKWFPFITTSLAKRHLIRAIRSRKAPPHKGRKIFEKYLEMETSRYKMPALSRSEIQSCLEQALERHQYSSLSHLYSAIENKKISVEKMADHIVTYRLSRFVADDSGNPLDTMKIRIRFAKIGSTRVVSGMPIVGRFKSKRSGQTELVIYGKDWRIVTKTKATFVPLRWNIETGNRYSVQVHIEALNRTQLLLYLLRIIKKMESAGLFLVRCETEILKNNREYFRLTLKSSDYGPLGQFEEQLNRLKAKGPIIAFEIKSHPFIEKIRRLKPFSLPNPYTSLPVSDQAVFKGREKEIEAITEKLQSGGNLVICYGPTRIGKTSLLQYIRNNVLAQDQYITILVDLLSLEDKTGSGFWNRLASRIGERLFPNDHCHVTFGSPESNMPDASFHNFCKYVREIREKVDQRDLVIILDEFSMLHEEWDPAVTISISRQIKSLLQENPGRVSLICCIQQSMMSPQNRMKTNPGLFDLYTRGYHAKLGPLDPEAAERLIREPVDRSLKFENGVIPKILEMTACHPYVLQRILSKIVEELNSRDCMVTGTKHIIVTQDVVETALQNELECGDITFYDVWHKCNETDKWLLKLISFGEIESGVENICRQCHEIPGINFPNVSREEMIRSLNYLCEEGLVSEPGGESGSYYSIHIPLFGKWLQGVRLY